MLVTDRATMKRKALPINSALIQDLAALTDLDLKPPFQAHVKVGTSSDLAAGA